MLRDTAIAEIQRGLAFRTDQFDNIVLCLQKAQRLLERGRTLPYFLKQEWATFTLVEEQVDYTLPTGFLREAEDGPPQVWDSTGTEFSHILEKLTDTELSLGGLWGSEISDTTGIPRVYSLNKSSISFSPAPTDVASMTIYWHYYKAADSLATNIENAWLEEETGAPEVLIARAGMLMAEDLFNDAAYGKFQKQFVEAYTGMLGDTIQRAEANDPLYMGGRL